MTSTRRPHLVKDPARDARHTRTTRPWRGETPPRGANGCVRREKYHLVHRARCRSPSSVARASVVAR